MAFAFEELSGLFLVIHSNLLNLQFNMPHLAVPKISR